MKRPRRSFGAKRAQSQKQLFVGREVYLQLFQENIRKDPYTSDFINIINLHGQGGVGKTTLMKRYRSMAQYSNYYTAFIDTEDKGLYEVTATMDAIARELEKQRTTPFKRFKKRYKDYLQEKGKLEADPERPKGTLGRLVSSGIKLGTKATTDLVPGAGLVTGYLPMDNVAAIAGEWADFAMKKIGNKDEVELVLHPLKVLTPLWLDDLYEIIEAEDKNIALFWDTFEIANPALDKWLLDLFEEKYGQIPSVLLVVGGRPPLKEHWNSFKPWTASIALEPFTHEEAQNYLEQRNITNKKAIESILSISGRLPVYLSLLADGNLSENAEMFDPNEKIVERFLKHITDPTQHALALHASLPSKLNQDVVECLLPKDKKAKAKDYFEWLKERPFVEKRGGYWAYHPIVRDIMLRYQKEISEKEWDQVHTLLADWYTTKMKKIQTDANKEEWFEDKDWCLLKSEYYFHLLCINYKKNIQEIIRDIAAIITSFEFEKSLYFITVINQVERILNSSHWGTVLQKGIESLMQDKDKGALQLFQKINQSGWIDNSDHKSALLFYQGFYEKNKDLAIKCYIEVVAIKPDFHEAFYNMGNVYRMQREQDKALECYKKAIAIKPDYHEAFYNMGVVYAEKGEQDKALGCYEKVIAIEPNDYEAFYNMGNIYAEKGEKDKALEYYEKAIAIEPNDYEAFYNMGNIYVEKGEKNKALEYYEKTIAIKPDYYAAYSNMGTIYDDKGEQDKALGCYKRAISINPNYHVAYNNMGTVYDDKGEQDKALKCYEKAIAIKPDDHQAFYNMGTVYAEKGKFDKALECYRKAIEIKPDFEDAWHSMGWAYLLLSKPDLAEEYLLKAWKLSDFKMETAPMNLGHVYLLQGDQEKALDWYKQSLPLWGDVNNFFEDMEEDYEDLNMAAYGISQEGYTVLLQQLEKLV